MKPIQLFETRASQYIAGPIIIAIVAATCFFFRELLSYHVVALLLLLSVSIIALVSDIIPLLLTATLSALLLNFLFIPPLYTFHIWTTEDILMFLMYYVVSIVNAFFTFRIKREERKTRERASRRNALKLYNTLFNSLSHELKTPIATIIGSTDLLKDQELTENQKMQLVEEINTAGYRLNQQVENLLSMSRLESGMITLNRDWCDINELLHTTVQQFSTYKEHTILLQDNYALPLFKMDAGLIQQALHNIIKNAVLYTPEGSTITLDAVHENEDCIITISDNGPGLPPDSLIEVFDKFFRSPGTKAGGTGLGLSIAKGFVEAHGGTIRAENSGGAKFTIKIPAEATYLNKLKNE